MISIYRSALRGPIILEWYLCRATSECAVYGTVLMRYLFCIRTPSIQRKPISRTRDIYFRGFLEQVSGTRNRTRSVTWLLHSVPVDLFFYAILFCFGQDLHTGFCFMCSQKIFRESCVTYHWRMYWPCLVLRYRSPKKLSGWIGAG